ncbi:hypothetical protein [Streptomyces sp. NPDC002553]|uniref:hypothetical protein n=1 Tax=unclassified Streptomyces TaxID=2593676 RepID=UPI0033230FF5
MDDVLAGEQPRPIRCPSCLEDLYFDARRLFLPEPPTHELRPWDPGEETNEIRRRDLLNQAFLKCPNERPGEHFLPVPYLSHGTPLSIAFVGQSGTGKTHLLAAMMAEIGRGGLDPYGIHCRSVNTVRHQTFLSQAVSQLEAGLVLPSTDPVSFVEFTDALLVTVRGRTRPVAFFDIAGESLTLSGQSTQFLLGVDALIFVVDTMRALRMPQLVPARESAGISHALAGVPDPTFSTVLDRLPRDGDFSDVPCAVVLNKCDVLRFEDPIDQWLRNGPPAGGKTVDPQEAYEESRDVYAFLAQHGASAWLRPAHDCRRCTLHFVSATGMSPTAVPGRTDPHGPRKAFVGGVRPRRVLGPLLSLFTMCGLLDPPVPQLMGV